MFQQEMFDEVSKQHQRLKCNNAESRKFHPSNLMINYMAFTFLNFINIVKLVDNLLSYCSDISMLGVCFQIGSNASRLDHGMRLTKSNICMLADNIKPGGSGRMLRGFKVLQGN